MLLLQIANHFHFIFLLVGYSFRGDVSDLDLEFLFGSWSNLCITTAFTFVTINFGVSKSRN